MHDYMHTQFSFVWYFKEQVTVLDSSIFQILTVGTACIQFIDFLYSTDAFGIWTDPVPTCQAITCPILSPPENGDMQCGRRSPNLGSKCR